MLKETITSIPAREVKAVEIVTKTAPGKSGQTRAETQLERRDVVVIRHVVPAGEEGSVYIAYSDGDEKEIKLRREHAVVEYEYSVDAGGFGEVKVTYYPDKKAPV